MGKTKSAQKAKITGWHTFRWYDARDKTVQELSKQIETILHTIPSAKDRHEPLQRLYEALRKCPMTKEPVRVPNIIPTAGRTVIARWIIGDNTYDADLGANYGSLGTSSAIPANADTQLGAEVYRKTTSSATYLANVAYLSVFYTATEVTGTFQEAGWHIAGTGSANTGQLLSHFLTGTLTKSNIETLTVESELTIS